MYDETAFDPRVLAPPAEGEPPPEQAIPSARQRRTADAFLGLQQAAADALDASPDRLLMVRGQVADHGSVALFHLLYGEGSDRSRLFVVTSFRAGEDRAHTVTRIQEHRAELAWTTGLERVS